MADDKKMKKVKKKVAEGTNTKGVDRTLSGVKKEEIIRVRVVSNEFFEKYAKILGENGHPEHAGEIMIAIDNRKMAEEYLKKINPNLDFGIRHRVSLLSKLGREDEAFLYAFSLKGTEPSEIDKLGLMATTGRRDCVIRYAEAFEEKGYDWEAGEEYAKFGLRRAIEGDKRAAKDMAERAARNTRPDLAAEIMARIGEKKKAEEYARRAVELFETKGVRGHLSLIPGIGTAYAAIGDAKEAEKWAEKSLEKDIDMPDYAGEIYASLGNVAKAEEYIEMAIKETDYFSAAKIIKKLIEARMSA